MNADKTKNTPCYRVVFTDRSLSNNYAFGGFNVQKQKLKSEGIRFVGEKVNLENHLVKI